MKKNSRTKNFQKHYFTDLPKEILIEIFEFLPLFDQSLIFEDEEFENKIDQLMFFKIYFCSFVIVLVVKIKLCLHVKQRNVSSSKLSFKFLFKKKIAKRRNYFNIMTTT